MAKICILEDSVNDVIRRYSDLTKSSNEIHVILDGEEYPDLFRDGVFHPLKEKGFKPENIHFGFENTPLNAAVYFCDGLNGQCFGLAERLGKDKVYINTTDMSTEAIAKERGLNILKSSPLDIIANLD